MQRIVASSLHIVHQGSSSCGCSGLMLFTYSFSSGVKSESGKAASSKYCSGIDYQFKEIKDEDY